MIDVTLQLWTRRERSSSYDSFSSASSNTDGMPFSVLAHDSGISTPLHNPFDEYRYMHTYLDSIRQSLHHAFSINMEKYCVVF